MTKLSFQAAKQTTIVLNQFYEARSRNDKDVILTVKKINGQQSLATTRLSEMSWCQRTIRWFGFGGSTLKSVAWFLQQNEPKLPDHYKKLQNRDWLACVYESQDVQAVSDLSKASYNELKTQKIRGVELFKQCVAHHNQNHRKKVYVLFQEDEKRDLSSHGSSSDKSSPLYESHPNPMGLMPGEKDLRWIKDHYKAPLIERNQFPYMKDFFFQRQQDIPKHVLGFCYEYGLGVAQNTDQAFACYLEAYQNDPQNYSAAYNLSRLYLQRGEKDRAIETLNQIQKVLIQKIQGVDKLLAELKDGPRLLERENTLRQHKLRWEKPLNMVQAVLNSINCPVD